MLYIVWVYEKVNHMFKKVTYVIRLLKSQSLQISILQHIAQDILHFILTSTHLRNFFSGDEGDLPVGFHDRFNSSLLFRPDHEIHVGLKAQL